MSESTLPEPATAQAEVGSSVADAPEAAISPASAETATPETAIPDDLVPQTPGRGALLAMTQNAEVRTVFLFQYTPERIVRERERGGRGVSEKFTIPFSLDATDALAAGDPIALKHGLHPALSMLDAMFRETYLLLSWGPSRVIPVTPLAMTVIETAFDEALNPIRADITFQAERITLTTDARLGKFVNAGAAAASALSKLYRSEPAPETRN